MLPRKTLVAAASALAVLAGAGTAAASGKRIVGGHDAPSDGTYDAVANVHVAGAFGCTGTLIAPEWVLSAGHCGSATGAGPVGTPIGWPPGGVSVTLGTTRADGEGGEDILVDEVVVPPEYFNTQSYDISLLHLATPSVQTPVAIAGRGAEPLWAPATPLTIAGFGRLESGGDTPDRLQEAVVPRVADAECLKAYPDSFENRTQLCAGYKQGGVDTCQGDSGGPLFGRDADGVLKVVGATSYGDGCAQPEKYGVYARVSDPTLREWIRGEVPEAIDDDVALTREAAPEPSPTPTPVQPPPAGGAGTGAPPPQTTPAAAQDSSAVATATADGAGRAMLAVDATKRASLATRGVRFRLRCPAACRASVTLRQRGRPVGRAVVVTTTRAGRVTRTIKVSRAAAARILARRGGLVLRATVRDTATGRTTSLSRAVRISARG